MAEDKAFHTFKHDMTAANFRAAVAEAITEQDEQDSAQDEQVEQLDDQFSSPDELPPDSTPV